MANGNGHDVMRRIVAGVATALVISFILGLFALEGRLTAVEVKSASSEVRYTAIENRLDRIEHKIDRIAERER